MVRWGWNVPAACRKHFFRWVGSTWWILLLRSYFATRNVSLGDFVDCFLCESTEIVHLYLPICLGTVSCLYGKRRFPKARPWNIAMVLWGFRVLFGVDQPRYILGGHVKRPASFFKDDPPRKSNSLLLPRMMMPIGSLMGRFALWYWSLWTRPLRLLVGGR